MKQKLKCYFLLTLGNNNIYSIKCGPWQLPTLKIFPTYIKLFVIVIVSLWGFREEGTKLSDFYVCLYFHALTLGTQLVVGTWQETLLVILYY